MTYVIGGATCPGADMKWTECSLFEATDQLSYALLFYACVVFHSFENYKLVIGLGYGMLNQLNIQQKLT